MGLSGPAPKPEGERRRTNVPPVGWTDLPREGRVDPVPKLPAKTPGDWAWSKTTREWWARLWLKPVATMWDEDDAGLLRLAALHDLFWRGESTASNHAEMRLIEDAHGLSPKAMLALRWRIVDEPAEDVAVKVRAKTDPRKRRALKLIEGEGA